MKRQITQLKTTTASSTNNNVNNGTWNGYISVVHDATQP